MANYSTNAMCRQLFPWQKKFDEINPWCNRGFKYSKQFKIIQSTHYMLTLTEKVSGKRMKEE